jgi:predicted DNA-binding transcriptional regulator AlpA
MKVLTREDLRTIKGIPWTRQHLFRKVHANEFPRPLKLGNGPQAWNVWVETEVDAWLAQRAAERK